MGADAGLSVTRSPPRVDRVGRVESDGVLLVDDDPEVQRVYEDFAGDLARARVLTSGDECLEVAARERVGVVVADQRMPGVTGTDVLRVVRAVSPCTVGIVVSAYAGSPDVLAVVREGTALHAIQKPARPGEIRTFVQEARALHERFVEEATHCDSCAMASVYGCDGGWREGVSPEVTEASATLGEAQEQLREARRAR